MKSFFYAIIFLFALLPNQVVEAQAQPQFAIEIFGGLGNGNCPFMYCIRQVVNGQLVELGPNTAQVWPITWTREDGSFFSSNMCLTNGNTNNGLASTLGQTLKATFTYNDGQGGPNHQGVMFLNNNCGLSTSFNGNIHLASPPETAVDGTNVLGCFPTPGGDFTCSAAPNQIGTVAPVKFQNRNNGLDAMDIFIIQQHVIGNTLFTTSYEYLAADVNDNGTITTLDGVAINNRLLGMPFNPGSPGNFNAPSWRFVPANFVFPNINPFFNPFPEFITTSSHSTGNDFIGVKVGDLNGNANPMNLTGGEPSASLSRSQAYFQDGISLSLENQSMKAGELLEIPIRVNGFNEKLAYQLALTFDETAIEIVDWNAGDLEDFDKENAAQFPGSFRALWYKKSNAEAVSMEDGSSLFNLVLKAKKPIANINQYIQLKEGEDFNKVFSDEKTENGIQMESRSATPSIANSKYSEGSVFPNPFSDQLDLLYPTAFTNGKVEIMDISGRLVEQLGNLENTVNLGHLSSGIYFVHFISEDGNSVEKVVKK